MPIYEYTCENCKKDFAVTMSLKEAGQKSLKCPHCNSDKVEKKYTGFTAVTSKKS